jgi:hypothetical protein
LSRYRAPLRKPFELIATAVNRLTSACRKIKFSRPSRLTAIAAVTAAVAAISVGTAMLWPASAASNPRAAAPRSQAISHAAAVAFADPGMDGRRARPAELVASAHQARMKFVKAEKARTAAVRRRAAHQTRATQPASSSSTSAGSAQQIASALLGSFGWGQDQFGCLDSLWARESAWNPSASNASSGAYGIPQALPGSKMASAGGDWQTNPATQIRWGLGYIRGLYGSPCGAWAHEQATGWY